MLTESKIDASEALEQLNANGHVVIPNLIVEGHGDRPA